MIYLELFLTFLEVGTFSFGGGYGMISLIRELCLGKGWLSDGELLNMIAVAESTPGPIAVNMATFVGSAQGGILGALVATLGVVLPSFIIILIIAILIKNLMKYKPVKAFMSGIRPCVIALILTTAAIMLLSNVFGLTTVSSGCSPDIRGFAVFAILVGIAILAKKVIKKKISPIMMIVFSAVLGIVFYGLI